MPGNASLAANCDGVSVVTSPITAELAACWRELGVKAISTRTVGCEHIDLDACARLGLIVSNVSYSPWTVAEFTVMTMLMCLRRMRLILERYACQDFTLLKTRGHELRGRTAGIIGTGQTGTAVLQLLSSFGCRLLCHSRNVNPQLAGLASYVPLDTLLAESDIVSLHLTATPQTRHIIDVRALAAMRQGAILINMARASLVDSEALISALESGHLGGCAMDVMAGEGPVYYRDFKGRVIANRTMAILKAMPNVLLTPHTAFFTTEAVQDMIRQSLQSLKAACLNEPDPYRLVPGTSV